MHGDASPDSLLKPWSARARNSAVSKLDTAAPATTVQPTMRRASRRPDTGSAPPVSIVRTMTFFCGSSAVEVARAWASMKCGSERGGTATRPSRSRRRSDARESADSSACCMSVVADMRSLPSCVRPVAGEARQWSKAGPWSRQQGENAVLCSLRWGRSRTKRRQSNSPSASRIESWKRKSSLAPATIATPGIDNTVELHHHHCRHCRHHHHHSRHELHPVSSAFPVGGARFRRVFFVDSVSRRVEAAAAVATSSG